MNKRSLDYRYNGAHAMIQLLNWHLHECVEIWYEAKRRGVVLPDTDDPDYDSLEALLCHILGAAGRHLNWICEKLDLPDPGIEPVPEAPDVELKAREYVKHLTDRWQTPLVNVPKELFYNRTWPARWGPEYCIDAMLEHAVMHPIRHAFQLQNLIDGRR